MGFLDSGIGEGLNQATGTISKTALNLAELQQQGRHMRALEDESKQRVALEGQRLNMQIDQNDRENKILDMKIQQQEKENQLIPIEESLTRLGFSSPEEHKHFIEKLNPLEVENIGGVNYISRKSGVDNFQKLAQDPEFNVSLGTIRMGNIDKGMKQIDAQLNNPESKLKPEQIVELQKQRVALVDQRTALANQVKMEQRKLKGSSLVQMGKGGLYDPINEEVIGGQDAEEWSAPYKGSVGGKQVMLQKNKSTGQVKAVAQDVSTTTKEGGGEKDARSKKNEGIKELKEFLKQNETNMTPEGIKQTRALISRVQNGTVDPDTIIYPDVAVGESGMTHSAKGKAIQAQQNKSNTQKTGLPKAGQVVDGYKFKGGNPADKKNWEKVK
ncbi:MAG: hypothetical protein WC332_01435 [Clostridia bacterium]|jgi:hypothetical protein